MDGWIARRRGLAYDADGAWAATGRLLPELLAALLAEPWFALPPPKSTGRDLVNPAWLAQRLALFSGLHPVDVQASLAEFTARAAAAETRLRKLATGEETPDGVGGGEIYVTPAKIAGINGLAV
jgi:anhydro-N-acetylmuramic acid kinase